MIKRTSAERVFNFFNIILLSSIAIVTLYPFLNIAAISFNQGTDSSLGGVTLLPRMPTLENYQVALAYPGIRAAFLISLSRTILHTFWHLFVVTTAAYALSKPRLLFRKWIISYFLLANYINPGLIPQFLNYRMLGLAPNNYLLYVLPGLFSIFNFAVIRTAIEAVPASLEESAMMDGAGYGRVLAVIVLPLIKPTMLAIGLFVSVQTWNEWQSSMIYFTKESLWTLQYILQRVLRENVAQEILAYDEFVDSQLVQSRQYTPTSIQMAILMVTTLPIIIVYPFIQKYFTRGIMLGAVKE